MGISKAQQKATAKYVKSNYDRIEVKVPRGRKEEIQAFAESCGESVNALINRLIDQELDIEPHTTKVA